GKKTLQTTNPAIPAYFDAVLRKHRKAKATFEKMPPSHRKEYIEWITEAKTEPNRQKRISTTIEWLAEGKSRSWQYGKK
ncbi:MAG: YdeI/OmpD-associated family protein, partial [Chitinophagales bacterium]